MGKETGKRTTPHKVTERNELQGRYGRLYEETINRERQQAAGNGTTGCSVKVLQFGNFGNAEKWKPFG